MDEPTLEELEREKLKAEIAALRRAGRPGVAVWLLAAVLLALVVVVPLLILGDSRRHELRLENQRHEMHRQLDDATRAADEAQRARDEATLRFQEAAQRAGDLIARLEAAEARIEELGRTGEQTRREKERMEHLLAQAAEIARAMRKDAESVQNVLTVDQVVVMQRLSGQIDRMLLLVDRLEPAKSER